MQHIHVLTPTSYCSRNRAMPPKITIDTSCLYSCFVAYWYQVEMEMGHLSWPMTHITHDPWPLHLRTGLWGNVAWWYWTTLSVLREKNHRLKLSLHFPPAVIIVLFEWVSSFLTSSENKTLQATAPWFHHGSMDHWQWPMTHWPISTSNTRDVTLFLFM